MEDRNSVQSSGVKFDCSLRHVGIDGAPLVMDGKCKLLPCLVCQFILLQTLYRNAVGTLERRHRVVLALKNETGQKNSKYVSCPFHAT